MYPGTQRQFIEFEHRPGNWREAVALQEENRGCLSRLLYPAPKVLGTAMSAAFLLNRGVAMQLAVKTQDTCVLSPTMCQVL